MKTYTFKYALVGVFFGFSFPLLAILIDCHRLGLAWNFESFVLIQKQNPIHLIIDTAPIFLGLFAAVAGMRQDKILLINNNLEDEVERQVASLKQSTLKLERALYYKEIFLANMSHEIRTPMNGIIGMLDLLKHDEKLNTQQQGYIDTIHESSLSLMNILNDVLDLSKIEEKKLKIHPVSIDLNQFFKRLISTFKAIAMKRGIELNYYISPQINPEIKVDENRLSQIISNLLGNALKFTEKGSVSLVLKETYDLSNKVLYKIDVIDSGIGIDEENLKYIFDEFYQLDNQYRNGTGLGLSICQKLTTLLGGDMYVKSTLGEGTTFSFTFEVKVLDNIMIPPIKDTSSSELKNFDLSILVVEDNPVNQKVATLILKKLGCKAIIASNGEEALTLYEPQKYDLIFMDIRMPLMDGLETTRRLKSMYDVLPPIVGLSANALRSDIDKYLAVGMDDYVSKPVIIDDISKVLSKWFDESIVS